MFLTTFTVKLLPSVDMPLAIMLPNGIDMSPFTTKLPAISKLPPTVASCATLRSLLNVPFNATMLPNAVILPGSVRLRPVILPLTTKAPAAEILPPLIFPGVTILPNKLMLLPTLALPPILASN